MRSRQRDLLDRQRNACNQHLALQRPQFLLDQKKTPQIVNTLTGSPQCAIQPMPHAQLLTAADTGSVVLQLQAPCLQLWTMCKERTLLHTWLPAQLQH